MRKLNLEKSSIAFAIFHFNVDIIESNLNRVLWSLNEIKYLLDSNPDLIEEFDEIFDDEEYDTQIKINETISMTLNQYYVLLYSHLDDYKSRLTKKIKSTKINKKTKTILECILPERNYAFEKYYEIRNLIVHKNYKIKAKNLNELSDYLGSDNKIHLTLQNYTNLFDELYNFCNQIDKKAIENYPILIA
jgi:hypothetical protein